MYIHPCATESVPVSLVLFQWPAYTDICTVKPCYLSNGNSTIIWSLKTFKGNDIELKDGKFMLGVRKKLFT